MTDTVSVVCMKWGTAYPAHYVNILRAMTARHLARPHRFVCLTDDPSGLDARIETFPIPDVPLPPHKKDRPWRKLALFAPGVGDLAGPCLFMDLDVVVVGAIDPFFDVAGDIAIIENWTQRGQGIGNSSVFRWLAGNHCNIYHDFNKDPDGIIAKVANEQTYLSQHAAAGGHSLSFWPDEWVRSFKYHCRPAFPLNLVTAPRRPQGARIIAFHGRPNPPDVLGHGPLHPKRYFRPAPWVADHWKE
jgi:hypothetical protein